MSPCLPFEAHAAENHTEDKLHNHCLGVVFTQKLRAHVVAAHGLSDAYSVDGGIIQSERFNPP
jgi:hypothetical protein